MLGIIVLLFSFISQEGNTADFHLDGLVNTSLLGLPGDTVDDLEVL